MGFENEASSSSYTLPTEDTPLIPNSQPVSSQLKTFTNVFIAIVGAGVLGLPYTFKRTGWVYGVIMIFTVAILTYHCTMLLVYTHRKLESHQSFSKIKSFGDLGFAVCGPVGRFAVDAMIVLSQIGFCVSYLIFIANTLAYVFNSTSPRKRRPTQKIKRRMKRSCSRLAAEPDLNKSKVKVKGVFDSLKLLENIYKKTGKQVVIVKTETSEKNKEEEGKKNGKEEEKAKEEKQEEEKKSARRSVA